MSLESRCRSIAPGGTGFTLLTAIVGHGSVTLHPKVASLSATTASVVDCAYSTSELIYAKSGKAVPPVTPPENDRIQATLELTDGTWKVSQQNVREGNCSSDS